MIGTIRKHSKVLWLIIIAATIISFVYWGANPGRSGRGTAGDFGEVDGRRIKREDYAAAQREVYLRTFFNTGRWPDQDADALMRETYIRLLLIKKQEDFNIQVDNEAVAKAAGNILRSLNGGRPVTLSVFASEVLTPKGIATEDFEHFIRHDLGNQQLISVAGLGGNLVTPQEAEALYRREHEDISTWAVFFSASNHLDEISVTDQDVAAYYTNYIHNYSLPDRVQVTYVRFPASNFVAEGEAQLAQEPNLEDRLETTYQKLGTNYFRDAKSPEEAKQILRHQIVMDNARSLARKKASEFATELYAIEPLRAENLGVLAERKGLTAHLSEPFDRQYPPSDLKVGGDFLKRAFALTPEEPFSETLLGEDAAYVIAFNKRLPSEIPPLEEIRKQVENDYKLSRAVLKARQAGATFAAMLAAGMPNGKSFSNIVDEAAVKPVQLPPFSISTSTLPEVEKHASLFQFKQAAFSLAPGKAGEFVPTSEGGFVVFVQAKLPVDEEKMKTDLPEFIATVRRTREYEAFNKWFSKEAEAGLRNTPLALRQQTATTSTTQ
jgi:peptidyl-prolyl cis-trans isomerase D